MQKLQAVIVTIAASLLSSIILQILGLVIGTSIPIFIGVLGDFSTTERALLFTMAGSWLVFGLTSIIWFRNHQKKRAERTLEITNAIKLSDATVSSWLDRNNPIDLSVKNSNEDSNSTQKIVTESNIISTNNDRINEEAAAKELRAAITTLLGKMCSILTYRLKDGDKGASVLILMNNQSNAPFGLFAHHRHDEPAIRGEILSTLRRDSGIAGQAVREIKCIVLKNCAKPPEGSHWVNTNANPRFHGRAALPIRPYINNQFIEIGALCFDTRNPSNLSKEDQKLALAFADKIGSLCELWMRAHPHLDEIESIRRHVLR